MPTDSAILGASERPQQPQLASFITSQHVLYALLVLAVLAVVFSLAAAAMVACRKAACLNRGKATTKSDLEADQLATADLQDRRESRASRRHEAGLCVAQMEHHNNLKSPRQQQQQQQQQHVASTPSSRASTRQQQQQQQHASRPPQGGGPCLNCSLIGMGSAIAYADGSCPQCGRFVDQE